MKFSDITTICINVALFVRTIHILCIIKVAFIRSQFDYIQYFKIIYLLQVGTKVNAIFKSMSHT